MRSLASAGGNRYFSFMEMVTFDTHDFVKRLTGAGMPESQAEILAGEQSRLIRERLATKRDIEALDAARERDKNELKRDIRQLETSIRQLENSTKQLEFSIKEVESSIKEAESSIKDAESSIKDAESSL